MKNKSRDYYARIAASALLLLALALSGTALAQDNESNISGNNTNFYENQKEYEYEADEGLHQEEWYDPSDWFNSGEGVSYETDWNDYYYGFDTNDGWFDDDYYGYNEHYGVAPVFGDRYETFDQPTYDYYTEDWYNEDFDSWLF